MKVQLLPSSFNADGTVSQEQRLTCFVVDDLVAFDAGSLAFSCTKLQRSQIRDVVISHTHLDHIAGLPIFIDDLFANLTEPIRVHATSEMIDVLERNVFNWDIYPRFSELENDRGSVIKYERFEAGESFKVKHLDVSAITVNHNSPSVGFFVSDGIKEIGITGDTAETSAIWDRFASGTKLAAIFVECAFPDEMSDLAAASHHLTPARLVGELQKMPNIDCRIFVSNIKAMYRDQVVRQLMKADVPNLEIVEVGKIYEF